MRLHAAFSGTLAEAPAAPPREPLAARRGARNRVGIAMWAQETDQARG